LRIEIEDNGKGMRPETLAQVKQKIEISEMTDKHSFGLHNIQQRLRILYGESSGLTFDTALNVGTCIGFSIPLSQLERKL
jgi:two-component system sensor histidine kinase YesM